MWEGEEAARQQVSPCPIIFSLSLTTPILQLPYFPTHERHPHHNNDTWRPKVVGISATQRRRPARAPPPFHRCMPHYFFLSPLFLLPTPANAVQTRIHVGQPHAKPPPQNPQWHRCITCFFIFLSFFLTPGMHSHAA